MEYFPVRKTDKGFHIDGMPDAIRLIKIEGAKAHRLADLNLHKHDLEFASQCLESIIKTEDLIIRKALWRSAVIHYMKCFGDSGARFQLDTKSIYKDQPSEAMEAFLFFKNMRNKHIVHDENSYLQSLPGAALNDGKKAYKIEKIICFSSEIDFMDQENYSNLSLLIKLALGWTITQFDQCCNLLTAMLEKENYDELLSRPDVVYHRPKLEEIDKKRSR